MAKRIKLQDRSGVQLLPLTRAELVQFTQITGLETNNLSVQAALEALNTKANNISTAEANNLQSISYLQEKLHSFEQAQDSVKNYIDSEDTAYLALAYAEAASKASAAQTASYAKAESEAAAAQANAYAEAASKASAAQTAAYNYANNTFLTNVKLNNGFVTVQTNENGRYVDLGSIATSTAMETLAGRVDELETAYVSADSAIVTAYTAADSAIITAYEAADTALSNRITTLETGYTVTLAEATGSGDIAKVYTISQGGATVGTINIPKDMVATSGQLKYGSMSGNTFIESTNGAPYIEMTVGNGNTSDTFYIPVADLIKYNSVKSNAEITLTDTDHEIEATVGTIAATKISYNNTTVDAALSDLYSQIGAGGSVTTQIENAINALDGSYTASGTAAHNGTFVMNAVTQTDGKITSIGSVEVEAAGAAATAKATIDDYTVNGKKISTNPTLYAGDIETSSSDSTTVASRLTALETADGNSVKSVNGQIPATGGAVTVNANQIDTVNTYKIGSETSATTHKVDEVLAAAVLYVEESGTYADTTI